MAKDAELRLEEVLSSNPILREEFLNTYKLRTTRVSPGSVASCAGPASTSCPSSSPCCAAT